MLSRDTTQSRCALALDFERIVEDSVFKRLNADTTPEQYQQAIASLKELLKPLEAEAHKNPFHHPAIGTGSPHHCVRDSFDAAVYFLKAGLLLAPVPKPEAPAPTPKDHSLVDVLKQFQQTTETYLGTRKE
jgi:hypothetical protein